MTMLWAQDSFGACDCTAVLYWRRCDAPSCADIHVPNPRQLGQTKRRTKRAIRKTMTLKVYSLITYISLSLSWPASGHITVPVCPFFQISERPNQPTTFLCTHHEPSLFSTAALLCAYIHINLQSLPLLFSAQRVTSRRTSARGRTEGSGGGETEYSPLLDIAHALLDILHAVSHQRCARAVPELLLGREP